MPPHSGGTGTSDPSGNRAAASLHRRSRSPRSGTTRDWGLAQAPTREPNGRLVEIGLRLLGAHLLGDTLHAHLTLDRVPRKDDGDPRLVRDGNALAGTQVGEEHRSAGVQPLSAAPSARSRPSGSTVATTIAFGSDPRSHHVPSQRWSCSMGSATRPAPRTGPCRRTAPQGGHASHHRERPIGETFVTPAILSQSGGAGCEG